MLFSRLKAQCTLVPSQQCQYWNYAPLGNVQITSFSVPLIPQIILVYPSTIGTCTDIIMDASGAVSIVYKHFCQEKDAELFCSSINICTVDWHLNHSILTQFMK